MLQTMLNFLQSTYQFLTAFSYMLILLGSGVFLINLNNHIDGYFKLSRYRINLDADKVLPAIVILDNIIESTFDSYLVLRKPIGDNIVYINSSEEKEMTSDIYKAVLEKLSGSFIERLTNFYEPEQLKLIISEAVYIRVVAFAVDRNQVK